MELERRQLIRAHAMPLCLYFIRHGETEWSLSSQHTGRTDVPLIERGEMEARAMGKRLCGQKIDRVFSSPRQRARRTCELAGFANSMEIEPDLAEWDYGDYEGRRSVEIEKWVPTWNIFLDGCPRGESPAQVSKRADRLIARLRTLDGTIALFSHGQFGCVFGARWIGLPVAAGQHFALGPTSLSILSYSPHHRGIPILSLWNSSSQDLAGPPIRADLGDTRSMKQRAIDRWENEGGEIPSEPGMQNGPAWTAEGRPTLVG